MRAFVSVARAGSFREAARAIRVPTSTLSHRVAQLEESLGARLFHRTTRKLRLSDVGSAFLERADQVLSEIDDAVASVRSLQQQPSGHLRVSAPMQLSISLLGEIVAGFRARYPDVSVEVASTDRVVDVIDEGFDVAIRIGPLVESSLIARPLAQLEWHAYASPAYLSARGQPIEPTDLSDHDMLMFTARANDSGWELQNEHGRRVAVPLRPVVLGSSLGFLRDIAVAGGGVAMLPTFVCTEQIGLGGLQRVLPGWSGDGVDLCAVYPSRRHLSSKVRAFLEHLSDAFDPPPWTGRPDRLLA